MSIRGLGRRQQLHGQNGRGCVLVRGGPRYLGISEGLVYARQAGQDAAAGEVVAHTDAQIYLPPAWIDCIASAFDRQPELVLASGPMRYPGGPLLARVIQSTLNGLLLIWWLLTRVSAVVSCGNFAVRANALAAAGGFAVDLPDNGDSRVLSLLKPFGRVALLRATCVVRTSARRFVDQAVLHVYALFP